MADDGNQSAGSDQKPESGSRNGWIFAGIAIGVLALVVVGGFIIALATGLVGDDDATPTPEVAVGNTSATATIQPSPVDGPTATLSELESILVDATMYCPEQFLSVCSEAYIEVVASDDPAALCVDSVTGEWYFEPPIGDVGDSCSRGQPIVVIVGEN